MNNNFIGIYIHIPFCISKCAYCDFYSIVGDEKLMDSYTDAVCRAIKESPYQNMKADSLYFGGGTPILLGSRRIWRIIETVHQCFDMVSPEITLEANPYSTIKETLSELYSMGVNRLSMGLQSSVDTELSILSRNHTADEAERSVRDAIEVGFKNISLDIMLGVPSQTLDNIKKTIDFCAMQNVSHISAYMLKIEENTPFGKTYCEEDFDEDLLSDMYLYTVDKLSSLGYNQYEISNFSKVGFESVHNLHYWNCDNYLGIGPSAHSFMNGERFYFPRDIHSFISEPNPLTLIIKDSDRGGDFEEYAMLRLRLTEGLNLDEVERRFGISRDKIMDRAKKLPKELIAIDNNKISLTREGFLLSNSVIGRIIF